MFKQLIPFTYYFVGINNIYCYHGQFELHLTYDGKLNDRLVQINSSSKLSNTGDIVGTILSSHASTNKILATVPFKILRELRRNAPQHFLFGTTEDEQKWYTKESILEFKHILYDYELPMNLIKNISQYLRTEDDNLKSMVALVKTIERYFKRRNYNHTLSQQLSHHMGTPL